MKKFLSVIFIVIFAINSVFATSVSAKSAVVIDFDTKEILYEKNANEVLSMASTTKIMTAIIALENANLDKEITVKREYTVVEGSSMYLSEGEKITMRELIYGLMLMSGNDAAIAIAHETTGDYNEFIALMNQKATELGLSNTAFKNPNGLDENGHQTTAFELAKLAAYALENDEFLKIVSSQNHKSETRNMTNHNKLLWLDENSVGVKTGYTKKSGRCLVSASEQNGKRLICVTLDAPSDWEDHLSLYQENFARYKTYNLHKNDENFDKIAIYGGQQSKILVKFKNDINLTLTEEQYNRLEFEVLAPKNVYAPIKNGEIYGEIVYNIDENEVFRGKIVYSDDVFYETIKEMSIFEKFIDFIKNLFY